MKSLVFNPVLVFCLLLTFIFVAMPAMAEPVEITISGEYTADDTTTTETDERLVSN